MYVHQLEKFCLWPKSCLLLKTKVLLPHTYVILADKTKVLLPHTYIILADKTKVLLPRTYVILADVDYPVYIL